MIVVMVIEKPQTATRQRDFIERVRSEVAASGKLPGEHVVSLMRRFRVTIRALSARMDLTQKRIRQVRGSGLTNRNAIRDWIEAITGEDPGDLGVG